MSTEPTRTDEAAVESVAMAVADLTGWYDTAAAELALAASERFWRDRAAADVAEVPVHEPTGNRRYAENVRADCVRAARGVS